MSVDLFFPNIPTGPAHPRLRAWKAMIESGARASLELYRSGSPIGLGRVRMFVHFQRDGQLSPPDECDWEPILNDGLIALGVRAVDQDNEIIRFALALRDGLQPTEKEFGNGYFNAVLLEVIHDSGLASRPEFAEVLKHTYRDHVAPATKFHQGCRDAIAFEIAERSAQLHERLKYSKEEATSVMTAALARYLDERFSVSARKRFGLA